MSAKYTRLLGWMVVGIIFFCVAPNAHAAYVYMDKESYSSPKSKTFTVTISIDTTGETPSTSDVLLLYDGTKLKVQDVHESKKPFFSKLFKKVISNKVYIGGAIEPGATATAGTGEIALVTFEALQDGNTELSFSCVAGKTTDTNINVKQNGQVKDVIDCTQVKAVPVVIGGTGGGPNPTVSPSPSAKLTTTLTPGASPTPTISKAPTAIPTVKARNTILTPSTSGTPVASISALPKTGITDSFIPALTSGIIIIIAGVILKFLVL